MVCPPAGFRSRYIDRIVFAVLHLIPHAVYPVRHEPFCDFRFEQRFPQVCFIPMLNGRSSAIFSRLPVQISGRIPGQFIPGQGGIVMSVMIRSNRPGSFSKMPIASILLDVTVTWHPKLSGILCCIEIETPGYIVLYRFESGYDIEPFFAFSTMKVVNEGTETGA